MNRMKKYIKILFTIMIINLALIGCSKSETDIRDEKVKEVKSFEELMKSSQDNSGLTPEQQKAIDSLDALLED